MKNWLFLTLLAILLCSPTSAEETAQVAPDATIQKSHSGIRSNEVPDGTLNDAVPTMLIPSMPAKLSSPRVEAPQAAGDSAVWDAWHRRVTAEIDRRYSDLTRRAGYSSRLSQLHATASFLVTRDGRILNAQLTQQSADPIYNTLVLGAVNSVSGNTSIVALPPGTERLTVEQTMTFTTGYPLGDFGTEKRTFPSNAGH
jgi:outer membrane biosynthesis protein TonB